MVGSFPARCALAASGQNVTAPAMVLTKSRRRITAPPQHHAKNTVDYSRDLGAAKWDSIVAWCRTDELLSNARFRSQADITTCRQIVTYPRKEVWLRGVCECTCKPDPGFRCAQSGIRLCHPFTSALRSSLPRSVFGSALASTICFGALKEGSASAQCCNSAAVSSVAPGRPTT